ncbi:hypothetical protein HHI36_006423 [Cryptolaemus montrouzieri]|uniref:Uncharacterized protein n=1 Tax=Cryptolaemus montrouzieri TaxID=559131 RepID=A0ABD2NXE8_9CUCU
MDVKLESKNKVVTHLESIIEHQKTIIDHQETKNLDVNKLLLQLNIATLSRPPKSLGNKSKWKQHNSTTTNSRYGKSHPQSKEQAKSENIVRGREVSSSFVCSHRKAWLYLEKAGLDTTEEMVKEHLRNKFLGKTFTVEKLPGRDSATSCYFIVEADSDLMEELYKAEN